MTKGIRSALERIVSDPGMNTSLWHDVYLPSLREEERGERVQGGAQGGAQRTRNDDDDEKFRAHLKAMADIPVPDGYERAFEARETLLRALRGGVANGVTRCFTATVQGRMAVGLGVASVTENSVALLRTWGTPYVPGSALKGLASSAAHRSGEDAWRRAEENAPGGVDAETLFGSTTTAGVVTFHDAWWIPNEARLPLDLDVLSVHHPKYYRGEKDAAPTDWDEPIPVSFLTARGSYLVALSGPAPWIERAYGWLKLALERDGIGAKTHAGYGRMTLSERLTEEERRARQELEALKNLPAQHGGPQTAPHAVQQLGEALAKGADIESLKALARDLVAKGPTFWKEWARDMKRSDAEKATLRALAMMPEEAPSAAALVPAKPVEAPTSTTQPTERPWLPAVAWSTGSGKKALIHARTADATYQREARELNLKKTLSEALATTGEAAPLAVEIQVKDGEKLLTLRAR